jgi:hypothetical protein
VAAKFDPKAKAKKQKIVAAVLGVVLVGVLVWQVPGVIALMNKKPAPPAPAAAVPPATGTPVAGTPVAAVPTGTLVDSDPAAQPGGGQLVSFDRFASKDPFQQQLGTPTATSAPATGGNTRAPAQSSGSGSGSGSQFTPAPPPRPAGSALVSARISVNGVAEQVEVGGTFPAQDPVFVLVAVSKTNAKVGISGGSLDTGSRTVTLRKGKKVTLQNTADGAQYELVLVSTS